MYSDLFIDRLAWAPRAGSRPARGLMHLRQEAVVPVSLRDTFDFFADATNLERLTPPWLKFTIRTPAPIRMREGLEIDYRIVVHGVPMPWRSLIEVWEPRRRFVDRQLIGPYRWWRHEHRFVPAAGGTRVIDEVEFVPRLRWITSSLVQRDLQRIFAYRRDSLMRILQGSFPTAPDRPGSPPAPVWSSTTATSRRSRAAGGRQTSVGNSERYLYDP